MPEHLDDFDLDRAFSDLLEEVGGRTNPPPASTVIERARRRRTTILAAAAAVVLIAGATAVASGVGRPSATPGPSGQLPAPHVLDRDAWAAATAGWIDGWTQPQEGDSPAWLERLGDPKCLGSLPDNGPEPERSGALVLVTDTHALTYGALADFDHAEQAQTSWSQISGAVSNCDGATSMNRVTWDGAAAESYRIDGKDGPDYIWLAREGQALGLVWVAGGTSPPSDATDTQVMKALVSGLQEPKSFQNRDLTTGSKTSGPDSPSAAEPANSIPEEDFAAALGSWDAGWERRGDKNPDTSLPCLSPSSNSAFSGGAGSSLGTNGGFEAFQYTYESAAATEWTSLTSELTSCNSAAWTLNTIGTQPQVLVASSDAGLAWIVRTGSNIGVVTIAGGEGDPPTEVSAAVGALIDQALRTTTP